MAALQASRLSCFHRLVRDLTRRELADRLPWEQASIGAWLVGWPTLLALLGGSLAAGAWLGLPDYLLPVVGPTSLACFVALVWGPIWARRRSEQWIVLHGEKVNATIVRTEQIASAFVLTRRYPILRIEARLDGGEREASVRRLITARDPRLVETLPGRRIEVWWHPSRPTQMVPTEEWPLHMLP